MRNQGSAAKLLTFLGERWAVVFLLLLVVGFSFLERNFLSFKNFSNIFYYATIYALLAAGETFVIISGGIDLSVGFVMGFAGVSSAIVMRDMHAAGRPEAACMLVGSAVGLALGLIPGLVNGLLVARLRVPPFIATLGTYGVANGMALYLSNGFPITFLPPRVQKIGNSFLAYFLPGKGFAFFNRPVGLQSKELRSLLGILPGTVLVTAVVLLVFAFLLNRSRFGQHTYAIGGSKDAAIRSGINVPSHLLRIYILSSMLAAVAGVLYVFRSGRHTAHFENVLEILACVEESRRNPFAVVAPALAEELGNISTVICILLDWDEDRRNLVRLAAESGCATKVLIVRRGSTSLPTADDEEWAGPIGVFSPQEVEKGGIEVA